MFAVLQDVGAAADLIFLWVDGFSWEWIESGTPGWKANVDLAEPIGEGCMTHAADDPSIFCFLPTRYLRTSPNRPILLPHRVQVTRFKTWAHGLCPLSERNISSLSSWEKGENGRKGSDYYIPSPPNVQRSWAQLCPEETPEIQREKKSRYSVTDKLAWPGDALIAWAIFGQSHLRLPKFGSTEVVFELPNTELQ